MATEYLYKDPISGRVGHGSTVAESEASGALAMTRAQAEDSLSLELLASEKKLLQLGTAENLLKDSYNKKIMEARSILDVKKPVNSVLIFIAAYLLFKRF